MPNIKIPSPLQSYVEGKTNIFVEATTVQDTIQNLAELYPAIKPHLIDKEGRLRTFINIFVDGENIKELQDGQNSRVNENSQLSILASIAGG
jgi:molybdopterin converting factor small subunit